MPPVVASTPNVSAHGSRKRPRASNSAPSRPKPPQTITHGANLEQAGELYKNFCDIAGGFGPNLGTVLFQLEERFGPSRFRELEAFLRAHGARLPLAVEVRHKDWFAIEKHREAYFGMLAELGISAVIVDTPGRRDLVHQRLTIPEAFIRFSGHDRSAGDLARIGEWAKRIKVWTDMGLQRLHFFTHHDPDYLSADWAVDFIIAVNKSCGLDLKVPTLIPDLGGKSQRDMFVGS